MKFGSNKIEKVLYFFFDGVGLLYKIKFSLVKIHDEREFNIKAEWNFFATSHGKGACDGIEGTVKRHAFRSSLQKENITTPKLLYEWTSKFFYKIDFEFCPANDHVVDDESVKSRLDMAKTLKNTRHYYRFIPIDGSELSCKLFSVSDESVTQSVMKLRINKK